MAEEEIYSHISVPRKIKMMSSIIEDKKGLADLLKRSNWGIISTAEVYRAICHDLKLLLDAEDVRELVKGIFSIENNLQLLSETMEEEIPSLDRFFRNLSPIFLQALYQNCTHSSDTDQVIHDWIEALRIAIEEEYYFWQEQLLEA